MIWLEIALYNKDLAFFSFFFFAFLCLPLSTSVNDDTPSDLNDVMDNYKYFSERNNILFLLWLIKLLYNSIYLNKKEK